MAQGPVRLVVRDSEVHGRGVFTKDPIAAGSLVERCPLLYLEAYDTPAGCTLMDYVFDSGDDGSWLALGLTSLINHSSDANVEVEIDGGAQLLKLRAVIDIAAGAELFINYGPTYFSDRGYE
jgi:SET domain-containing protein